jgi:hypothetical protein
MTVPGFESVAGCAFLSPALTQRLGRRLQRRTHVPNFKCQCVLAQVQRGPAGMCRSCAAANAVWSAALTRRRAIAKSAGGTVAYPVADCACVLDCARDGDGARCAGCRAVRARARAASTAKRIAALEAACARDGFVRVGVRGCACLLRRRFEGHAACCGACRVEVARRAHEAGASAAASALRRRLAQAGGVHSK